MNSVFREQATTRLRPDDLLTKVVGGGSQTIAAEFWEAGGGVQNYPLIAVGISVSPALGIPAVSQNHVITALGIETTPIMGTPALTEQGQGYEYTLVADGLTITVNLGTPALSISAALPPGPPPVASRTWHGFSTQSLPWGIQSRRKPLSTIRRRR